MRIFMLAMAGVLAATSLAHAGKKQHLEEATNAARALRPFDDNVDINVRSGTVSRGIEAAKTCFQAIDAAVKAGASMEEEFAGDRYIPHARSIGSSYTTNLSLVSKYCTEKHARVQLARAYLAVRAAFDQGNRMERAKSVYDIKLARATQQSCTVQVERALKMKNKPSITLIRPETTLGEAQGKVCGALAKSIASARGRVIAKADLSGFSTELKGDRLKAFKDNLLYDGDTFGSEKFPLKDPEDFANSDVWYEVYTGTDELSEETWTVRVYTFKESKLVSTEVKRGEGEAPPKELFR